MWCLYFYRQAEGQAFCLVSAVDVILTLKCLFTASHQIRNDAIFLAVALRHRGVDFGLSSNEFGVQCCERYRVYFKVH